MHSRRGASSFPLGQTTAFPALAPAASFCGDKEREGTLTGNYCSLPAAISVAATDTRDGRRNMDPSRPSSGRSSLPYERRTGVCGASRVASEEADINCPQSGWRAPPAGGFSPLTHCFPRCQPWHPGHGLINSPSPPSRKARERA